MKSEKRANEGRKIRLAGVIKESIVDGPGFRFVVFCQGCPHACKGCHNPESHDFGGGYDESIERLVEMIKANPLLDGVTFSGGEPFCQADSLADLAYEARALGLNVITYSGYVYEELTEMAERDKAIGRLLNATDYLIDGPYVETKRDLTLSFRGSANQRIIDLKETQSSGVLCAVEQL